MLIALQLAKIVNLGLVVLVPLDDSRAHVAVFDHSSPVSWCLVARSDDSGRPTKLLS